jgi:hypothetical protein
MVARFDNTRITRLYYLLIPIGVQQCLPFQRIIDFRLYSVDVNLPAAILRLSFVYASSECASAQQSLALHQQQARAEAHDTRERFLPLYGYTVDLM